MIFCLGFFGGLRDLRGLLLLWQELFDEVGMRLLPFLPEQLRANVFFRRLKGEVIECVSGSDFWLSVLLASEK